MKNVVEILKRVEGTSSTKEKENILKENKDNELLQKVLYYTYHPRMKYKVTEKTIVPAIKLETNKWGLDVFAMLDELAVSNINDKLRREIGHFLSEAEIRYGEDVKKLYIRMLLKDLRCNISEKTVNKVWRGLIPVHKVMLADKFEGTLRGDVAVTTKMDGLRCSVIAVHGGNISWLTRQGKEIEGLNELTEAIKKVLTVDGLLNENIFFEGFLDGELIAVNNEGLNSGDLFRKTVKIANSKSQDKTGLRFVLFDCQSVQEYNEKKCTHPYSKRRKFIEYIAENDKTGLIEVVKHHAITNDPEEVYNLLDKVVEAGEEGLMLNYLDGMYEYKRSKQILKVKPYYTADLLVTGMEIGTGKNANRLGTLYVDYKGFQAGVGYGFSDAERDEFWNNRDTKNSIIGRVVEIRYTEESNNKDGGLNMRFARFKRVREEGKEVSYY